MKFSIMNLGCKVNAYEAESIAGILENRGYTRTDFENEADIALIFTCAVTNTAAQKSRKMLHRIKRTYPEEAVAMIGCYSQIDDGKIEDADIIIGTAHKAEIPDYIDTYFRERKKIKVLNELAGLEFENLQTNQFENRSRAFLKIQDGCNQFCSYCIIPYARGRERSMEPSKAVQAAKKLSENYREIVLTGIHTGRYGREHNCTLTELIQMILDECSDLQRLRISSIEITEITDELIELMKKEDRIARHLHIPLQSGCDSVLKNMRRPYSTAEYYDKIEWIRKKIPDVAISCDLIVGFPQESEEDFQTTVAFLKKCRFSFLHVFPYSPRIGTVAEGMKGQIDPQIKKQRARICLDLSSELMDQYCRSQIGKSADVVAEQYENGYTTGYTSQYVPVRIAQECEHGRMVKVRLKELKDHIVYADREEDL